MRENIFCESIAAWVSALNVASGTPNAAHRSAISDAPAPDVDSDPSFPGRLPYLSSKAAAVISPSSVFTVATPLTANSAWYDASSPARRDEWATAAATR